MDLFYKSKVKKLKSWYGSVDSSNYFLAEPKFECDLGGNYAESKKLLLVKRSNTKIVKVIDLNSATFEKGQANGIYEPAFFTIIDENGEKIDLRFMNRNARFDFFRKLGDVMVGADKMAQILDDEK